MNQKTVNESEKSSIKTRKYSLTEEERTNIISRQTLIKEYQYLIHVINADIVMYTNETVCKRVGLKEGEAYSLSPDNSFIVVEEKDDSNKTKQ